MGTKTEQTITQWHNQVEGPDYEWRVLIVYPRNASQIKVRERWFGSEEAARDFYDSAIAERRYGIHKLIIEYRPDLQMQQVETWESPRSTGGNNANERVAK